MPVILLDRDGVINQDSPNYIKSAEEWQALPGSIDAIVKLKQAGFRVAVATNQSGLARAYFDWPTLEAMHEKLRHLLREQGTDLDAIFICPHHPNDGCDCRKPLPGLLKQAAHFFNVPTHELLMMGDSWKDIEAARAVGAEAYLLETGNGLHYKAKALEENIPIYTDLATAAMHVISVVKPN